jgi:hypothetical protein
MRESFFNTSKVPASTALVENRNMAANALFCLHPEKYRKLDGVLTMNEERKWHEGEMHRMHRMHQGVISVGRREILLAAIATGFSNADASVSMDPNSQATSSARVLKRSLQDFVRDCDLIVLGKVEGFIFRGARPRVSEEYRKDFSAEKDRPEMALHGLIRISRIIKTDMNFKPANVLRVYQPVPRENYMSYIGVRKIFLLKKGSLLQWNDPSSRLYEPMVDAIPSSELKEIIKIVTQEKPKTRGG